jgi:hypothetical protein
MTEFNDGTRAIVKMIVRETLDQYESKILGRIDEKINAHANECEARKYGAVKTISIASIGGAIVAFGKWLINKL